MVDTFWVGRGLGPAALAGVSTAGFTVWMMLSMAQLAPVGLTAVASRRHGERKPQEAAVAVYRAYWLAVGISVVLGLLGLFTLTPLFGLMATPADVTVQGSAYLAVYLAGAPIVFTYFVMEAAFRAGGDTRTPLILLAVSLGLNTILDPLLILGIGPFPRMGIQGAALATLVTRALGCFVGYRWLVQRGLVSRARISVRPVLRIAWIGLPVAAGGALFSFVYIVLTRFTSQFGTAALAALGVGHKVESLSYMVCIGFGLAAATAVGQNLGAGQRDRAVQAGRVATGYAVAFTGFIGLAFLLVPGPLMSIFTPDPDVIAAGTSYLRIVAVAQVFMALEIVLQMGMEGAGYSLIPWIPSSVLTLLRLPLAPLLSRPLGLAGIWWTISATAVARGLAALWIWRRRSWLNRTV
ncbi:MAG: MATE family efflux transporter [marine benthic group bacterium]|nr:MATE family efflux transporter [Candidatus Benthicola marisminoris]